MSLRHSGERNPFYGRRHTDEVRKMIGAHSSSKRGENSPNWRGGINTPDRRSFVKNLHNVRKRLADGSHTFEEWDALKKSFGNKCLCCGSPESQKRLTEDHVIALSKGGTDWISNIQPLCLSCNIKKMSKTIDYRRKQRSLVE